MFLNESPHPYLPTFNGLKHGNTAFGKASLLVVLVWVTFSYGYTFVGACFEGSWLFLCKVGEILKGVVLVHKTNSTVKTRRRRGT